MSKPPVYTIRLCRPLQLISKIATAIGTTYEEVCNDFFCQHCGKTDAPVHGCGVGGCPMGEDL